MSELTRALEAVTEAVSAATGRLNELDGFAGDGDLGVTMGTAADELRALLPTFADEPADSILAACGQAIVRHAPSTAGTLIGSALIAAGRAAGDEPGAGASELARLLEAGYDAIARLGKAERGAKTMLDALGEAVSAARAAARGGADVGAALRAAAAAADSGARATREMIPRHGRAGWLAERAAGHEDAGARLVAIVLAAASA